MATKKNNALKREQYGIPLPLPCLQKRHQEQQQQKQQAQSTAASRAAVHPTSIPWTRLDPLLHCLRYVYIWSKAEYQRLSKSHGSNLILAEFHPLGESVWVRDSKDISILFRQGFFGKGTLSRSEPTWKQRNDARSSQDISLEEITRKRRIERTRLKQEKQMQLRQQQQGTYASNSAASSPQQSSASSSPSDLVPATHSPLNGSSTLQPLSVSVKLSGSNPGSIPRNHSESGEEDDENENENESEDDDVDYEHLQLSLEEAFFLVFGVECLAISESNAIFSNESNFSPLESSPDCAKSAMSIQECWLQFAAASVLKSSMDSSLLPHYTPDCFIPSPGNRFVVRYIAYHYYRSQGWIVKDGLKYGTDFLLYRKGLVFGHSQYGVRVVPSCDGEWDMEDSKGTLHPTTSQKATGMTTTGVRSFLSPTPGLCVPHAIFSWQWLLSLNRVIAQVQKTVILCHVVLPRNATRKQLSHPRTALPLYRVVEIGIKRFIPEKNRA